MGPKTAVALLQEHGSLDALLVAAAEGRVKPKRAAAQLTSGAGAAPPARLGAALPQGCPWCSHSAAPP